METSIVSEASVVIDGTAAAICVIGIILMVIGHIVWRNESTLERPRGNRIFNYGLTANVVAATIGCANMAAIFI